MRRLRSLLVLSLSLGLVASDAASAEDTVVGHVERPTMIRTYAGIQVFSEFVAGSYYLAILRRGSVERLPIAPSAAPFAADIGPDRKGRPKLIYTRCNRNRGCDLFVFSLAGGGSERPVRGANTSANEVAPTLWKGRIAFARALDGRERTAVYTRNLAAPSSQPSERLRVIPRRQTTVGSVAELELRGDHLAQIVKLHGGRLTEVRLIDISDGSIRRLARAGVGEAGQYFAGIGFANGYLAWTFGGSVGRERAGIYRDRVTTGALSRAEFPRLVDHLAVGLALFASDSAYIVDWQPESNDGCGGEEDPPILRPCQVIRSTQLKFRPIRR